MAEKKKNSKRRVITNSNPLDDWVDLKKETEKISKKSSKGLRKASGEKKKKSEEKISKAAPEKPVKEKRKNIPKRVRRIVWNNHCGEANMKGKCFACHQIIDYDNWHAGHRKPASKGGSDTADNLRPLCVECNLGMGDQDMSDYIKQFHASKHPDCIIM